MSPIEIQFAIRREGKRQSDIARELGVSPVTVCQVVHGKAVSRRVRAAIAKTIGRRIEDVWPCETVSQPV